MVVLYHMSAMHEMGHTAITSNAQPAAQAPEARPDPADQKGSIGSKQGGGKGGGRGGTVETQGSADRGVKAEGTLFESDVSVDRRSPRRPATTEVWGIGDYSSIENYCRR